MLHADGPHAIFFRAAPHTIEAGDGKNEEGRCCQAAQVALCATLSSSWTALPTGQWQRLHAACCMPLRRLGWASLSATDTPRGPYYYRHRAMLGTIGMRMQRPAAPWRRGF